MPERRENPAPCARSSLSSRLSPRRDNRESAVGAIIVRKADPKLRYAVKSNERLSQWEYDDQLEVRQVA